MNIQQIGPNRLRILLDVNDLDKFDLDYLSINTDSHNTMVLLRTILLKAKKDGFCTNHCKILVEVLPDNNSGCILYITKSVIKKSEIQLKLKGKKSSGENDGYILTFDCLDDAIGAISNFSHYPDLPLKQSRLYKLSDKWYLVFDPVNFGLDRNRLISLLADLSEYGSAESKTPVREALLEEHGEKIVSSRAIESFIRFFS